MSMELGALKDRLREEMKTALKENDHLRLGAIRLVLAEIKNKEIDKRGELDDKEIVSLLQKEIKKRQESMVYFEKGNRQDLLESARREISVLEKFLPRFLSREEVAFLVEQVILSSEGNKAFGQIMKEVLFRTGGLVDGKMVSEVVKQKLNVG
ncbi:MAG: GatB/YqeY domain-containing protein [Atribacterota bacterium]|nr:GatB/YqeY domain-containing protein [Candidatus Atribacteria bacterium]